MRLQIKKEIFFLDKTVRGDCLLLKISNYLSTRIYINFLNDDRDRSKQDIVMENLTWF